jgi:hypothetical protein
MINNQNSSCCSILVAGKLRQHAPPFPVPIVALISLQDEAATRTASSAAAKADDLVVPVVVVFEVIGRVLVGVLFWLDCCCLVPLVWAISFLSWLVMEQQQLLQQLTNLFGGYYECCCCCRPIGSYGTDSSNKNLFGRSNIVVVIVGGGYWL